MNVKALLADKNSAVITVDEADAKLADASALLAQHRIGAVVVTDPARRVKGIFSERDLVRAIARHGAHALERPVTEFMTPDVVTCGLDDPLGHVMRKMNDGKFRHLPVLDGDELIGIISIRDVVSFRMVQMQAEAEAMREYIAYG